MIILKAPQAKVLAAVQAVAGIVERKNTLAILSNVMIRKSGESVQFTASDLNAQIQTTAQLGGDDADFGTTVSARKLIDILRSLPADQVVSLKSSDNRLTLQSGKSRFTLQTLPAQDFPLMESGIQPASPFSLPRKALCDLIEQVDFAMAANDVRFYLNGVYLQAQDTTLRVVATDGHRLAYAQAKLESSVGEQSIIIPRKAVLELKRLMAADESSDATSITVQISANHASFQIGELRFVTKLIDGKYPDYNRAICRDHPHSVTLGRLPLLASLQRSAIMVSDKFKGISLSFDAGRLSLSARNNEAEELHEELDVEYTGPAVEIGLNVAYLQDALSALDTTMATISFTSSSASINVTDPHKSEVLYVLMPMRQ
jgi:DNA polymerase-3 subunit beta